ncbi:MAG: class I SAM-dependent methyltransferase [Rhodospirillales bacterium]|nr:class I SAM-dependent methyltransferase [Rhodospirillales bacterium]
MTGGDHTLTQHLAALIEVQGPIPVSVYMAEALGHPDLGYYMTREPLGRDGDFITAPEISQMFGELIGIWCVDAWQRMGSPLRFCLVELGPGRGTLMTDVVRALRAIPGAADAAEIHLVETSPRLAAEQRKNLEQAGISDAHWHQRFADVPGGPLIVIANEFFDALPIRQFVRAPDGWQERLIDLDPETGSFKFTVAARPCSDPNVIAPAVKGAPEGSIAETCPAALALIADLAERLSRHDGAVLIIDYGTAHSASGDSLQAVRDHAFHPILEAPGSADLTAHVDFAALTRTARSAGIATHGPVTQGQFLKTMGIEVRAAALAGQATPDQQQDLDAALTRLTSPDQMGDLFKVLALSRGDQLPPAGFEPAP